MHITRVRGKKRSASSRLSPNRVIAKDVKSCTYCYYVRCTTLLVRVGGMPWPKIDANQYHIQFEFPDKGRAIKELVVCNDCIYCLLTC